MGNDQDPITHLVRVYINKWQGPTTLIPDDLRNDQVIEFHWVFTHPNEMPELLWHFYASGISVPVMGSVETLRMTLARQRFFPPHRIIGIEMLEAE